MRHTLFSIARLFAIARRTSIPAPGSLATQAATALAGLGALFGVLMPHEASAGAPAEAANLPPVTISVLVSTRTDRCYDMGYAAAVTRFVRREQQRINRQGGIGGRRLEVDIVDDMSKQEQINANLRKALQNPNSIATIGLTSSNRGKPAFEALGHEIDNSGQPFISDLSLNSIFAKHANVFTTRASQDQERMPATLAFIERMGIERLAFIGLSDMVFSTEFGNALKATPAAKALVVDQRLASKDDKLDPAAVAAAVAAVKDAKPGLVMLAVTSVQSGEILRAMMAEKATPPVLMLGRIDMLPADIMKSYPSELYQLSWDDLPEVYNDRLRRAIGREPPENWYFERRRMADAPGWAKGDCKVETTPQIKDPLETANLRAIVFGAQFADMVALVAAAASAEGPKLQISELRALVLRALSETYTQGRGAFKGSFDNWSFDPASRTAARTPYVIIRPQGLGRTQLAQFQFVRLKSGRLKVIDTLYADIDLIRTYNVDDNDKSFSAEFYLSMRANAAADITQIDFVNAYLDPKTNGRQIVITALHDGSPSAAYPGSMKIYKVSGRFLFEPDLANFPFDTQLFAINIQPKLADAPFIVQPPPLALRDKAVETDGWTVRNQYVGYRSDFVPLVDAYSHEPSIVPFYTASYVWQMDRQTTDYFLRVVVPLAFILIVAYLSIFIPQIHFEAIVTIQVTALLSAVALYFSIPKLSSDIATLSDRIFVFDYMMVCFMIVVSILRVNRHIAARPWLKTALAAVHIVGIPVVVGVVAYSVHNLSTMVR